MKLNQQQLAYLFHHLMGINQSFYQHMHNYLMQMYQMMGQTRPYVYSTQPYLQFNPYTQVNPHLEINPYLQVNPNLQVNPYVQVNPNFQSNIELNPDVNLHISK